jgi:diacylglycerol kinase (ATP)
LWSRLGELVLAVTQHPEEVAQHLDKAVASGLTRVISIGGDGTNHALVNALAALSEQHPDAAPLTYGMLPVGTGRDWARSTGIPLELHQAADWIASAKPHPTDIGQITYDDGATTQRRHFLNIASTGLGGEVDRRVNQAGARRPWTFLGATVASILAYRPGAMRVTLDGQPWFEGKSLLVAVANGTTFGHGMVIAPRAAADDGLFDVVLVENASKLEVLTTLRRVYDGSHLTHPAVRYSRAREVAIDTVDAGIALDLDGEHAQGGRLRFSVRPGLLHLLRA